MRKFSSLVALCEGNLLINSQETMVLLCYKAYMYLGNDQNKKSQENALMFVD